MPVYEVEMTTTIYNTIYVNAKNAKEACNTANSLIDSGALDMENSSDVCFTDSALFQVQAHEVDAGDTNPADIYNAQEVLGEDDG